VPFRLPQTSYTAGTRHFLTSAKTTTTGPIRLAPDATAMAQDAPHAAALAQLFEAHNRSLKSFLMARLGNEQEVQEVTQEAYARLLQLHQPGAISFLRAYLFKTAAHIAVDRERQRRNRHRIDQALGERDLIDLLAPDRHALAAEQLQLVEQALRELPPNYRRAFMLRRYDEWTPEQIARELNIRLRMVRKYISRATIYCKLRVDGLAAADARRKVLT
jgi:RNA polymerase sigma factor (sigma-70 family)